MDTVIEDLTALSLRRFYRAPVAAVYAAWTTPEQLSCWMGANDAFGPADVTMDVRPGGAYRIVMHAPDGETHCVNGVFRDVVPGRKLVYTWAWASTPERESLVTVEFAPVEDGTELVLTHRRFADSDARDRHLQGWTGCLGRLDRYMAR